MVAALLVRRGQYLERGLEDPFPAVSGSGFASVRNALGIKAHPKPLPGVAPSSPAPSQAAQMLHQVSQQQQLNKSLLKVTRILDESETWP